MYPFLKKLWNCVVGLPVFSAIKHGAAVFSFFSKQGTNETSRADFITEVKMIKTGKGIDEASFQMIHCPSDADYYFLSS
jgi:hypothetical protein